MKKTKKNALELKKVTILNLNEYELLTVNGGSAIPEGGLSGTETSTDICISISGLAIN